MASLSHTFEFAFLKTLETIVAVLPRRVSLSLGAFLGSVLYRSGYLRHVVAANMDWTNTATGALREPTVHKLYRNFGRYCTDLLQPVNRFIAYDNDPTPTIQTALSRNKGTLIVLGHLGNWEVLAALFGKRIDGLHAVTQTMHNPLVGRWLEKRRAAAGIIEINRRNALRPILSALKRCQHVAILIDQYPGKHGSPAPFLGKSVTTVRTVAGLKRRTGAPVLLACALLRPNGSYHVQIVEGRELDVPAANEAAYISTYQKEHNDVLSDWVREFPDHYLGWFHKRFKGDVSYEHKPKKQKASR